MPARLTSNEMEQILGFGQNVLSCDHRQELRQVSLNLMEEMFRSESANFFLTTGPGEKLDLGDVVTRGITDRNLERFNDYYYRLDPFIKHYPPPATVLTMDQLVPRQNLESSEYYNDFLKPQHIGHQMTIAVKVQGRVGGIIALFRPENKNNFNQADKTKAEVCASYISGVLERIVYADQALKKARVAEALAAGLPGRGVIVADERLEILYSDFEAENLLGRGEKTVARYGKIARACEEVRGRDPGEPFRLLVDIAEQSRPVEVNIRLISGRDRSPMFLITLGDPAGYRDWTGQLKEKGISPRELEVIHMVAGGLSNSETARRLYISSHTVENHLKNIFRKLGVKSRTQLIGQILALRH